MYSILIYEMLSNHIHYDHLKFVQDIHIFIRERILFVLLLYLLISERQTFVRLQVTFRRKYTSDE